MWPTFLKFLAALVVLQNAAHGTVIDVSLETSIRRPWLGFGYNQYPQDRDAAGKDQPWTAEHWKLTTQRMEAIHPSLVRINVYRDWFNADGGRPLPVGQYRFNSESMLAFEQVLQWYQDHDTPVMTGLWSSSHAGQPQDRNLNTSSGAGSFAQLQCDLLWELVKVRHLTCIRWFTPVNEPGGSGITMADWSVMVKNLAEATAQRGLPGNMLVGADTWDGWTPFAAEHNHDQLSAYEHHKYLNNEESVLAHGGFAAYCAKWLALVDATDSSGKPTFLGEEAATDPTTIDYWYRNTVPGMFTPPDPDFAIASLDLGIQVATCGESGALAWSLDGFDRGKDPGMWNISGANGGLKLRPWFYTWSLLCRAFPAGSRIYSLNNVRGMFAKTFNGCSLAIVNRSADSQSIALHLPNGATGAFDLFTYTTNTAVDGTSLSLPSESVNASMHILSLTIPPSGGVVAMSR